MWHQVKLQYYIYYFKNLLLELLKITQEGGGSKIFGTGIWGGGSILKMNKVWGSFYFKVEIQKKFPAPPPFKVNNDRSVTTTYICNWGYNTKFNFRLKEKILL